MGDGGSMPAALTTAITGGAIALVVIWGLAWVGLGRLDGDDDQELS